MFATQTGFGRSTNNSLSVMEFAVHRVGIVVRGRWWQPQIHFGRQQPGAVALQISPDYEGNMSASVRRQGFWNQERLKLNESLAHLVSVIMRRVCCDASVAFRASCV